MKVTLTTDEYLSELNARLQQHPLYRAGMQFVANPDAPARRRVRDLEFIGPSELLPAVVPVVEQVSR